MNFATIPPMENQWKSKYNQRAYVPLQSNASVMSTQHRKLSGIQDSAEV